MKLPLAQGGLARASRLVLCALLIAAGCALVGCTGEGGTSSSPSTTPSDASVDGHHWAVWVDNERSGHLDARSTVRAFDLDAGVGREVCMVESVKLWPAVSSRWVVWLDGRGGATPSGGEAARDLYCFDLTSGQERRLTEGADLVEAPAIDGDIVVWADWLGPSTSESGEFEAPAIALDLASGARRDFRVPGARAYAPIVSEGWVAWWSIEADPTMTEMSSADIRVADFSSGEIRAIEVDVPQPLQYQPLGLAIDALWLAWQRITGPYLGDPASADIALASVEDGRERTVSGETSDESFLTYPAVSGEHVIWYDGPRTGEQRGAIFAGDVAGGTPRRLCQADVGPGGITVGGDWVAWAELTTTAKGESECDIVAYNLATDERRVVCAAAGDQWSPRITGEWVVWEDARNTTARGDARTWDIYACNLETGEELAVCTEPGNQGWLSVSK